MNMRISPVTGVCWLAILVHVSADDKDVQNYADQYYNLWSAGVPYGSNGMSINSAVMRFNGVPAKLRNQVLEKMFDEAGTPVCL